VAEFDVILRKPKGAKRKGVKKVIAASRNVVEFGSSRSSSGESGSGSNDYGGTGPKHGQLAPQFALLNAQIVLLP
jgi:hypothetical protein